MCIALFIQAFLSSCENQPVFERNQEIKAGQWKQNDLVEFDIDINDSVSPHNFYINIRHGGNYQYSNIFFFIGSRLPNGKSFMDTLECALADNKGQWFGKGIGDICDVRILFKKNVIFPLKGKYHFTIEQAMRTNPLAFVYDVGLRIEKSEGKPNKKNIFKFSKSVEDNFR